jgi:peptidoglycan/LPS O-acetylase OafA/YrhL
MKLVYRPEIDGLRAIAVLSVIIYHTDLNIAGFRLLKGGFLGVDIFLVISGYLITSIILKELYVTNGFSFLNFYERRARRILPALLIVMLTSVYFAHEALLLNEFNLYKQSIYTALGFISNFFFYSEELKYFDQDSSLKPFLHTWSLAVEEQFYIIFPIGYITIFRFFKLHFTTFIVTGFIGSLMIAQWTSTSYPSFSFYLLPTRMWELLAGAGIAYLEIKNGGRLTIPTYAKGMPTFGLFLIILSILFYPDTIAHPSLYTLPSIIGTCLIICFAKNKDFGAWFLSRRPLILCGLISYSLYLWHYPILAFARVEQYNLNDPIILLTTLLLIATCSIASYFLVEQPFRNKSRVSRKHLIQYIILFTASIVVSLEYAGKNITLKIKETYLTYDAEPWSNLEGSDGEWCYERMSNFCRFGNKNGRKIILIGDSQISALQTDLKEKLERSEYELIVLTSGACYYGPNYNIIVKSNQTVDARCPAEYQNIRRDIVLKNKQSFVVIGGMLPVYLSMDYFDNGMHGGYQGPYDRDFIHTTNKKTVFEDTIKTSVLEILNSGSHVILIYPFPEPGWHLPQKIKSLIDSGYELKSTYEKTWINRNKYENRTKKVFNIYDSIEHPNLIRIYPHEVNCNEVLCKTHDKKNLFYIDTVHQSEYFSKVINSQILAAISKNK